MFKKFIDKIAGSREKVPPCFSGVIDPIIVRWEDGSYHSSPFCLRPGNVITKSNIIIDGESYGRIYLKVNNKLMDFQMFIRDKDGIAYFDKMNYKPSQEQIKKMNLEYGANELQYLIESKWDEQVQQISCKIFVYNQNSKLFISDIDGTVRKVTKSDLIGYFMNYTGKTYSHDDICKCYNEIHKKGYNIIYLSARSMVQYSVTRKYFDREVQDGQKLPLGPLVLSDEAIYEAFKVEVIYKNSDELKVQLLLQISEIFGRNPYYGGIGNKDKDVVAYRKLNIPFSKIFLINKQSLIKKLDDGTILSYNQIANDIDSYFV